MTYRERLLVEIQTIETMLWLIKDRASTLDAYRAMESAQKQREKLLERDPPVIIGPNLADSEGGGR